jgi:hypothetical protein
MKPANKYFMICRKCKEVAKNMASIDDEALLEYLQFQSWIHLQLITQYPELNIYLTAISNDMLSAKTELERIMTLEGP